MVIFKFIQDIMPIQHKNTTNTISVQVITVITKNNYLCIENKKRIRL